MDGQFIFRSSWWSYPEGLRKIELPYLYYLLTGFIRLSACILFFHKCVYIAHRYGDSQHQRYHKNIVQYEGLLLGYFDAILHVQLRQPSQLNFQNPRRSKQLLCPTQNGFFFFFFNPHFAFCVNRINRMRYTVIKYVLWFIRYTCIFTIMSW